MENPKRIMLVFILLTLWFISAPNSKLSTPYTVLWMALEIANGRVLCVGIICCDIVNHLSHYPKEDENLRAFCQMKQSGGNATNTSKVLSLLGRNCDLLSTVTVGTETE